MTVRETAAPRSGDDDDMLARVWRWLLAKVWLGCILSGGYALGRHFGWPQALLSAAACIGAVALALAALWLPAWTRERPTGVVFVDIGLRVIVWAGLALSVLALLVGIPEVGTVAGALLLSTAWRTFGRQPEPRAVPAHPRTRKRPAHAVRRHGVDVTQSIPNVSAGSRTYIGGNIDKPRRKRREEASL